MPAIASPSSLVELVQTLQEQQQQSAEAAAAIAQTLKEQQRHQQEQAAAVSQTLGQISRLLSSLLGGLAPVLGHAAPAPAQAAAPQPAAKFGGNATAAPKPAAKSPSKGGRSASKFTTTGVESVLAFISKRGNPTSAEVNQHWQTEGRSGKADITLSQLTKAKKLKRTANPAGRGSRYTIV